MHWPIYVGDFRHRHPGDSGEEGFGEGKGNITFPMPGILCTPGRPAIGKASLLTPLIRTLNRAQQKDEISLKLPALPSRRNNYLFYLNKQLFLRVRTRNLFIALDAKVG